MIIKHDTREKLIFKDIILNEHGSENKLKHLLSILARKKMQLGKRIIKFLE